jgi:predicted GNAT family acetyltransferase
MYAVPSHRLRIRPAAPDDANAIGDTHAAAWNAAYTHIFDPAFLDNAAQGRRDGWRQTLPRLILAPNIVLVAERDGNVIGFAHASTQAAEPAVAEIHGFYVHPDAWGSDVAEALMTQTCSALAANSEDVVLWTLREAQRARHFYEKVGFRSTGRERAESLTDWTSGTSVERPAVEYARTLAPQRITPPA